MRTSYIPYDKDLFYLVYHVFIDLSLKVIITI